MECAWLIVERVGPNLLGRWRLLAAAGALLALTACADRDRLSAVPANATSQASVLDIPDARIFASDPEAFARVLQKQNEREIRYYASMGRPLPPENVLALSGGGDNGAFGAGLLVGLTDSGTRPAFKAVTGISAGALIAPFAFLGPEYDPILEKITTIEQGDVFIKRPFVTALFADSVNDTSPLKRLIATYIDQNIVDRIAEEYGHGRALVIISTDLDAGVQVVWNIGAIAESRHPQALALIRQILLASASVPAAFPPVMFNVTVGGVAHQELHVDGGAITQTFLYPAAVPLGKLNASVRRARTAYIVRNGYLKEDWTQVEKSTLAIAQRSVSTLTTASGIGDLYRIYTLSKRDGIGFRLAYIRDIYDAPHPSEFDREYTTKLFKYARAQARAGNIWQSEPPGLSPNPSPSVSSGLSPNVSPLSARRVLYVPPAIGPAR